MTSDVIAERSFSGLRRNLAAGRVGVHHAEMLFLLFGLTLTFGTIRDLLGSGDVESGNPVNQALLSLVGLGSIGLLARHGFRLKRLVAGTVALWPMLLLLGVCFASIAWSIDASVTFRRLVALGFSTAFTVYIVTRFDLATVLVVAAAAFALAEAAAVIAALIPGHGITPSGVNAGGWRSFTGHKNEFGAVMAVALLFLARNPARLPAAVRRIWVPLLLGAAVLLVLSDSKTSLVAALVGLGGGLFCRLVLSPRRMHWLLRVLIAALALSLLWLTLFAVVPLVVEAVGRDLTFSGRENIWEFVRVMNAERELLGAGYRAFWTEQNTAYFLDFFWWYAPGREAFTHAHSSYMDVWAELGWLGVAALAVFLVSMLPRIRDAYATGDMLLGDLLGSMLVFALVYSYTARFFLVYFDIKWLLLSVLYGFAALARHRARWAAEDAARRTEVAPPLRGLSLHADGRWDQAGSGTRPSTRA